MSNATRQPAEPDVVRISGLHFTWPGRHSFSLTIENFSVSRGERLMLIGPSGGGKSTFLSLLAGILTPQRGSIEILGTDITRLSGPARDRFRSEHFGIIFQMFNLLPYGSVIDNVLLPLHFSKSRRERVRRTGKPEVEARRLLEHLGLEPALISGTSAASLSVGQQQRVAAARALIGMPEVVIADEPTSALDRSRQTDFLKLLFANAEASGSTLIMVTHDESLSPHFSRVVRLDDIAQTMREAA
ncbi:ABC transporter related protein [Candidatus Filomicrobium marinum]|uniref:ABC transporter related protein n=1 Tax=Candidatus Filomicrobium marinum TaxID=1608628 RepID=A0A0D6JGB2_9HYPH|nr:ABC transporter ATP-binding protein [Candidatus Filomicrobium marinum]CFX25713.1 ABC transporter related protein [Candidatus Filomicrobium marinum]CPR19339.1 ABC transporter related protein [Candidatus Filomicrobium marinum]